MSLELDETCPECDETRTFWKTGRTRLHLGIKQKWQCNECGYGFVRIDGAVDTGTGVA